MVEEVNDNLINNFRELMNNERTKVDTIVSDYYYEWKIDNWNSLNVEENSPNFLVCDFNSSIQLNKNKDSIGLNFKSNYLPYLTENDTNWAYITLFVRNPNTFSCIKTKQFNTLKWVDKECVTLGSSEFISNEDLNKLNEYSNRPLIENNKVIVGIYICKFVNNQFFENRKAELNDLKVSSRNSKATYRNSLVNDYKTKKEMWREKRKMNSSNHHENESEEDYGYNFIENIPFEYKITQIFNDSHDDYEKKCYIWDIKEWDELENEAFSPEFTIDGHKWEICLYPNGKYNSNIDYVSMFLKCLDFTEEDSNENSNVYVKFALCIINPNESTFNHVENRDYVYCFNKNNSEHGFVQYIEKFKMYFCEYEKSLLECNKIKIAAYISVVDNNNELDQYRNKLKESLINSNNEKEVGKVIMEDYIERTIIYDERIDIPYVKDYCFCKNTWRLSLYRNNKSTNDEKNFSLSLKCIGFNEDLFNNSFHQLQYIIYVRKYNSYDFKVLESSYISNFNKFNSDIYSLHPLKLGDILNNDKNESSEESSKIIFGVYGHILSLNIDEKLIERFKTAINEIKESNNPNIILSNYIGESNCEREINYYDKVNIPYTKDFVVNCYKWRISLILNDDDDANKDYLSLYLKCLNFDESDECFNKNSKIIVNYILYIRNYKDQSCIKMQLCDSPVCFKKECYEYGFKNFILKKDLRSIINEESKKPLLEDELLVIGAFIRIYRNENSFDKISSIKTDSIENSLNNKNESIYFDQKEPNLKSVNEFSNEELQSFFSLPPM
jgi:hypothetical protein